MMKKCINILTSLEQKIRKIKESEKGMKERGKGEHKETARKEG